MSEHKIKNLLYSTKLFFEPNKGSEELTFPSICRFIRQTLNVTQREMAEKLGVGLSTYQPWEYGKREPASKIAVNLCFLYLQCLYITNQTPKATQIKTFLDSLVNESADTQKQQGHKTEFAA